MGTLFPAATATNAGQVLTVNPTGLPTWVTPPATAVTTDATAGNTPTTNPPANPNAGDVFINTTDGLTWMYDGGAWQSVAVKVPRTYFGVAFAGAPTAAGAPMPTAIGARFLDKTSGEIFKAVATGSWPPTPVTTMQTGDTFYDVINNDVYEQTP